MEYSAFVNDCVLDCPGLPVPVALRAIREAVRTFCRDSTAYRKDLTAADLTYASGLYTITIPTGFQIETLISPLLFSGTTKIYTFSDGSQSTDPTPPLGTTLVSTDTYAMQPQDIQGASQQWLDLNYPHWRHATSNVEVDYFCSLSTNTFMLIPDNGVDRKANLALSLVLLPDRSTSPTLNDEFCNRWFDDLVAGAKFLLMASANTPWSNPKLSQFYAAKFQDGIRLAKCYARSGLRNPQADGIHHVRSYFK